MKKSQATKRYEELRNRWEEIENGEEDKDMQEYIEEQMEKAAKKISRRQFEEFLQEDECMEWVEWAE